MPVSAPPLPPIADANELAASVYPIAVRYAYKQAQRNPALAERLIDAATDAVLRALRNYRPGGGSFKAFAWRVIKDEIRVAVRRYRDRKARRPAVGTITEAVASAVPAPPVTATGPTLPPNMSDLPADERAALRFYYLDGFDLEDTGLLMGMGKDTVRKLLGQAARTLAPDLASPDRAKGARHLER